MAHPDLLLHRVPGGACHVGNNSPVIAQQGVEQGGFAHVGAAQDHRGNPQLQQLSPGKRGQQLLQPVLRPAEGIQHVLPLEVADVLVGIVHHGVKPGDDGHEAVVDLRDGAAEGTPQLAHGVVGRLGRFGVDEVRHGLRLEQIHPPVEKRPAGELAALGLAGSGGKQGVQRRIQHHRAAVTLELAAVLAGVAAGAGKQHRQGAVDDPALSIQHVSQHQAAGLLPGHGTAVFRAEHPVQGGPGPRPGQAHHPDSRRARGGGNGGDGIRHGNTLPYMHICVSIA